MTISIQSTRDEQTEANPTSEFHYRFILRPETIIPNVDVSTSAGEVG